MRIRIAARGSKLSLKQVEMFKEYVMKYLDVSFDLLTVKTSGDKFTLPFEELAKKGYVGLFEKEVNKAVLEGRADVAVHSLKDLSTSMHPDLEIVLFLPRDPPYDVLVSRNGKGLMELEPGSIVGTSSARRKALIMNLRPDLKVKDLRGNVDTRLRKLREGQYDAIILAEAGLVRLGMQESYERLDWRYFPPSPGQGIVVAVAKKDTEIASMLKEISDKNSEIMARAERAVLRAFGGGCHVPLGAISFLRDGILRIRATTLTLKGEYRVDLEALTEPSDAEKIGYKLGEELKSAMRSTVGSEQ
ncbi:porphobilinogen deaminase [Ignicoccus pacificus DSM 13166]|uniref:Probable porphobilinogen deaminase n=1 Tax=Ignicoccus pacificus DSM 13166 TaxID=940294 RepID=A0A977PJP5_9CREN|nr:porphobilinogen deaminase [Ignicoccus pacificus DSM 13166]